MSSHTIARTALAIAVHVFETRPEASHRCFRVKNLLVDEIKHFVELWPKVATRASLAGVRLISAESLGGAIPDRYVAADDRSITYYRNNNPSGLIYVETRVQSDEQGLQNIFTLRDSNFLDGSFDSAAAGEPTVCQLMIQMAWSVAGGGAGEKAPRLLVSTVNDLMHVIHPTLLPIPARRFADFAEAVCSQWGSRALDQSEATKLAGRNLWLLGLFPDEYWCSVVSDARTKRRLMQNTRFSELSTAVGEIDLDALEEKVRQTRFIDAAGAPFAQSMQTELRASCVDFIRSSSIRSQSKIPYHVFEQLFAPEVSSQLLGDRVQKELAERDADRLPELIDLDIVSGLNSKLQVDAERLINAEPPTSDVSKIFDILTPGTRKLIERIATPKVRRFFNPCIELVRFYKQIQSAGSTPARIMIDLSPSVDSASPAIGLFAFMFAESLRNVERSTEGMPSGCELVVSSELTRQRQLPPIADTSETSEEDEEESLEWTDLSIRFTAFDSQGSILEVADQMRWSSDAIHLHAMLWILSVDAGSPLWKSLGSLNVTLDEDPSEWFMRYVQRVVEISSIAVDSNIEPDVIGKDAITHRLQFSGRLARDGISVELLDEYGDQWQSTIERARLSYVPSGRHIGAMDALLTADFIRFGEDPRRVMLPTHPIRLRWMSAYLKKSIELTVACLTGDLNFSVADGSEYLEWLEARSPHESPAVAVDEQGRLLYSKGEFGWFEDFGPIVGGLTEVTSDRYAIESIGAQVVKYLEAHPYKEAGLSILVVLPSSDDFAASLIGTIAKGRWKGARIAVTVAVPKGRWESIARRFEELDDSERSSLTPSLFPRFDLTFVDFDRGADLIASSVAARFDLAVVTHILQDAILCQPNTEAPNERAGRFDPLLDRPVVLDKDGDGGSISVVMRPRDPDRLLESWSTLVVRANRTRPVSPDQPENMDFVELRVNFEDSARLFSALHEMSHWVITLERHISRQQIESREAGAPDVLSIQDQVGNNGLSTLIVSSSSGRRLIESRIARKLLRLVPADRERSSAQLVSSLSARIYQETRRIAPHLALRAMGISRVTEEILGLFAARLAADRLMPTVSLDGFEVWVSLDEHADWFGGTAQVRPDMCRLLFERNPIGSLDIDVLVLEGKLRQNYDAHGVDQVHRGLAFFTGLLGRVVSGAEKIDAPMWRDRLISAIEATAPEARRLLGGADVRNTDGAAMPGDIRAMLRAGKYSLRNISGLYCITLWDEAITVDQTFEERGVTVVKATGRSILGGLAPEASNENSPGKVEHAQGVQSGSDRSEELPEAEFFAATEAVPEAFAAAAEAGGPSSSTGDPARHGKMSIQELSEMYGEVLACFSEHGVTVHRVDESAVPFVEGPASILFRVRPGHGVDPKKLSEKSAVLKLGLKLSEEQNVAFGIDSGYVTIDVPKTPEQRYFIAAEDLWLRWEKPADTLATCLGEDRFGEIVTVNFSSPNSPHLLVGGTTGSGKSEALNTILHGLCNFYTHQELRLLLVDPKGTELLPFEGSEYLHGAIGWDDSDAIALLQGAVTEMQRRYSLFKALGTRTISDYNAVSSPEDRLPWWIIVLDEYADLTSDPQSKKEIEQELKRLAQKARASGIHLIIATQKPSAEVISTNLRSNLPAQIGLRVKSATESRVLMDEAGAELLNGKGDALFKADGKVIRVQCARVMSH